MIASGHGIGRRASGSGPRPALGFTLTELLIVVAIIAIVAAFALPNYTRQMQRTRRADALDAVLQIAAEQEKRYIDSNTYASDVADLGFTPATSANGYYTLETAVTDGGAGFTVTATAASDGPQTRDTPCQVFTYDHTGRRGASDGTDDTTDECWR
ncbi:MAG: type IV pilin protein [Pseudomonadota bacterium]